MAEPHKHQDDCYTCGLKPQEFRKEYGPDGKDILSRREFVKGQFSTVQCYHREGELVPIFASTNQWLADYFNIDLKIIDQEKRAMLNEQRALNQS